MAQLIIHNKVGIHIFKMPNITLQTEIRAYKSIMFNLTRSLDLHTISTKQTNEKAIVGKTSGLIGLNERVTCCIKHFGIYHNLAVNDFAESEKWIKYLIKKYVWQQRQ